MAVLGQEVYDISSTDSISIGTAPDDGKPQIEWHDTKAGDRDYRRHFPFPPGTRGVFYYHRPPDLPSIAGELRFRICDHVSNFMAGADPKMALGSHWRAPLYWVVKWRAWESVLKLLVDEGCVQKQVVDDMKLLPRVKQLPLHARYLYEIDEPFLVPLESLNLAITFITRHSVNQLDFKRLFASRMTCPYKGLVRARFETIDIDLTETTADVKKKVEDYQKANAKKGKKKFKKVKKADAEADKDTAVVLRVLEALTPIECVIPGDHLIAEPRPGELLLRKKKGPNQDYEPWIFTTVHEVTDPNAKALKTFLRERKSDQVKYRS